MDWPLSYVHHRVRLQSGQGQEIDLLGAIGIQKWVCQRKWVTTQKMGVAVLQELLAQGQFPTSTIRMWLFAYAGLTQEAETLARELGILWSDRTQLDGLLTHLGLRKLPTLTLSPQEN